MEQMIYMDIIKFSYLHRLEKINEYYENYLKSNIQQRTFNTNTNNSIKITPAGFILENLCL